MRRILYVWKGFEFYSYTVMLYFGLLAGIIVGNQAAHHLGIDPFSVFIAQFALIPLGFIGGRAVFHLVVSSILILGVRINLAPMR